MTTNRESIEVAQQPVAQAQPAKKAYATPVLTRHGNFEDKTLQIGSGIGGSCGVGIDPSCLFG
jgi:hypothetical protein